MQHNDHQQAEALDAKTLIAVLKRWYDKPDKNGYEKQLIAVFIWKVFTAHQTDDMARISFSDLLIDLMRKTINSKIPNTKTGPTEATLTSSKHLFMSPFDRIMD